MSVTVTKIKAFVSGWFFTHLPYMVMQVFWPQLRAIRIERPYWSHGWRQQWLPDVSASFIYDAARPFEETYPLPPGWDLCTTSQHYPKRRRPSRQYSPSLVEKWLRGTHTENAEHRNSMPEKHQSLEVQCHPDGFEPPPKMSLHPKARLRYRKKKIYGLVGAP
ncbi:hypothetical protein R3P38DRAFT_2794710 [Favolaschia claudopus]|uniref:Uncharacterized protein n=1 Tax=Favolaschia claudopus TaxID=2862362 RepID=A0AAW0A9U9_9AGAR